MFDVVQLQELMEGDNVERLVAKAGDKIKDDLERIYEAFDNGFECVGDVKDRIGKTVDKIRSTYENDIVPDIAFEIFISGINNELAGKPSLQKCLEMEMKVNKWVQDHRLKIK